jgi:hypothetical protein
MFSPGFSSGFWGIFLVATAAGGGELGFWLVSCVFLCAGTGGELDFWSVSCVFACAGAEAGGRAGEPPKSIMATRTSENRLPRKSNLGLPSTVFFVACCKAHHSRMRGNFKARRSGSAGVSPAVARAETPTLPVWGG